MKVISVNIGSLTKVKWRNKTIETGIFKYPVDHPIFLDLENVQDDSIVNRVHHGGIEQAVYAYGEQHYAYWKERYPNQDWSFGMFGENLTISNFDESKLHVGAIFQLGEARIQVTKPRQPCMKLGIRFNTQKIVKDFWNSNYPFPFQGSCAHYLIQIRHENLFEFSLIPLLHCTQTLQ